jgi:predicted ATPase
VAINYWLQYLEVAYSIKCGKTDQNSLNWQVVYQKGQQPHTFAGDSLAVNQVLPLLVMGLLAPEGSLLLIEHPELFLHQRAQARLGDFFVGLAACHKRCLIETHSENLVTQLRYHIVREGEHNPNKYMIYFADRNDEGATRFIPIKISPRGNILNWPEGFFDETNLQEEKISIAYLRRKAELAMKQEQLR